MSELRAMKSIVHGWRDSDDSTVVWISRHPTTRTIEYELVPVSEMDALRKLAGQVRDLAADGGYHQEECPNYDSPCDCVMAPLYADFAGLSPEFIATVKETP